MGVPVTYIQASNPTELVLSLNDAYDHLVLSADDGMSNYITSLIKAATKYCESYQRRCYVLTEWEAYINDFPLTGILWLQKSPINSLGKIEYKNDSDNWETLPIENYECDILTEPAQVYFKGTLPTFKNKFNNIRLSFSAGYSGENAVPENIKAAIKLIVGHLYEHREEETTGVMTKLPLGVEALLDINRVFCF